MSISTGISVIIPVYNSASTLDKLLRRLCGVLDPINLPYELILVNDSSPDNSWECILQLAPHYPMLRGINLMRNSGQHNALLCGIRAARYDLVVTLDDDLQNPPEEIPKLLRKLADGFDVVYGTPRTEQHGLWRDLASRVTKLALKSALGANTADMVSTFRVFRTNIRDAFANYQSPYVSIDVLLTWGTTRFAAVMVHHHPRESGVSNYTFRKLMTHALNMITGFSTWPLQFASLIGFTFTLFGLGVLAFVLGRYVIQGVVVQGFVFLASIIATFAGATLFALGIMGEYLARMHLRMMERPTYTIRSEIISPTNTYNNVDYTEELVLK